MKREEIEVEISNELGWMVATVEVEWHYEDASYSHEFGVKQESEMVFDEANVLEVLDEDGERVDIDRELEEEIEEKAMEQLLESM